MKFRNARHQHVLLTKGNKDKVQEVEILEDKCNQAMMLKFGRIVDIDSLGTVTVSRAVEEARDAVRQNEIKLAKEEHKMEQQVQALKSDLSKLVCYQTLLFDLISMSFQPHKNMNLHEFNTKLRLMIILIG